MTRENIALMVNEECLEAANCCVGGFDVCNEGEIVNGKIVDVKNLGRNGKLSQVLSYWRNEETIGGAILWDSHYYHELSEETLKIFEEADRVVSVALKNAFD